MKNLLTLNLMTATLGNLREAALQTLSETAEQARHMYHGHHLGKPLAAGVTDFSYWRGPMVRLPEGGTEQQKREAQAAVNDFQNALARSFTSTNFVKETLVREIASCTSKMSWTLVQTGAQRQNEERTPLEAEADTLLIAWWRTARKHPEKAIRTGLTFGRREERGVLRFRVASGVIRQDDDGKLRVKTGDMTEIARYIRLEHLPRPEDAVVWEHPDTFDTSAVYAYTDAAGVECAESCHVDPETGRTVLRVHRAGEDLGSTVFDLDLGGRITYLELKTDPAITRQFLQNQMAFNTASTMILRNTELAGFLERWGINIEPPSELIDDPNRPGQKLKRFAAVKPGAGTMMAWQQSTVKTRDTRGQITGEQPLGPAQYGKFDPASPEALISATTHNMLNMYSEVGQSYVLMGKDATASGRSREVAISDFDNIRQATIDLAEATIGEVAETFLALVSALAGKAGYFRTIQVEGQVKGRIVPPSAEDRMADREDVKAGVISRQTARQRQGIDDPEQEDAQIQRETEAATPPPAPEPKPGPDPQDPPTDPPADPPGPQDPPPDPEPKTRRPRGGRKGRQA